MQSCCGTSVKIDGTSGCGESNGIVPIPPVVPDSIPIFVNDGEVRSSQTYVDGNGNIYEGTGLFIGKPSYPNDPFTNITHNRIFFESIVTSLANTAPVPLTGADLNWCNIDNGFFNAGNTLRAYMTGQIQTGVNPVTYGVFFHIYDVIANLQTITAPALMALTPYTYDVYVTFRDTTTIYYMIKFEYYDVATNAMKTFMTRGGPVTIDQASVLQTVKITANTALASPDSNNNFYSDQCQFSYS
jgi:hypothetical protein